MCSVDRPTGGFEKPSLILRVALLQSRLMQLTALWAASLKDEHFSHNPLSPVCIRMKAPAKVKFWGRLGSISLWCCALNVRKGFLVVEHSSAQNHCWLIRTAFLPFFLVSD